MEEIAKGRQVRTDLAVEAHQLASEALGAPEIPGVKLEHEEIDGMRLARIQVENEEGARQMGKPPGHYITIEVPGLRKKDSELQERVAQQLTEELSAVMRAIGIKETQSALVIGLGNRHVTADALGPVVVENLLITRHLFELMPDKVSSGYRNVSALAPGVLGVTGIETSEVVKGIVEKIQPDFVIAVDALASRSIERVNTTIQIADTGISPGSGVGNKRKALNRETLGVPVVAIGCPTVVDAVTIAHDTIDYLFNYLRNQLQQRGTLPDDAASKPAVMGVLEQLSEMEKKQLIFEILSPLGQNLMVTPKEVDAFIEDMGNIVANGLNAALHQAVDQENVSAYTH